jgi:hypothetical protein
MMVGVGTAARHACEACPTRPTARLPRWTTGVECAGEGVGLTGSCASDEAGILSVLSKGQ